MRSETAKRIYVWMLWAAAFALLAQTVSAGTGSGDVRYSFIFLIPIIIGAVQILAGAALGGTLISAGLASSLIITGVLGIAGALLAPKPAGGPDGFKSSPRYGFSASSNTAFEGAPRMTVLGEEQVAPAYISSMSEIDGKKEYLKSLLYVSTGGDHGIHSITDIKLNDQPIENFPGVTVHKRLGTSDQTVIKGFEKTSIPWPERVFLDDKVIWTWTTHRAVDEVGIVLQWLSGLYGIKSTGSKESSSWKCKVEYHEGAPPAASLQQPTWIQIDAPKDGDGDGDTGWQRKEGGVWRVTGNTRNVKRMEMRLSWSSDEVRTIRITSLKGNGSKDIVTPTLTRVDEITEENNAYAGSAILGIEFLASEQLSGQLPRVTCVVRGWKVTPMAGGAAVWTRNPAELTRALLLDKTNGLGDWISADDIADGVGETWRIVRDKCDELAASSGDHKEPRFQMDLVIDSFQPAPEWLNHMLGLYRAELLEWGGQLHLVQDVASSSVKTFDARINGDDANRPILALSDGRADIQEAEIGADERATHVTVTFFDRDQNYERVSTDEIIDPNWDDTMPRVTRELFIPGITRETQALRHGRYALQGDLLRDKVYGLGIGLGDLDLLPMDRVTVYADNPAYDGVEMQVRGVTYGEDGLTGKLLLIGYDAGVYTDTTDKISVKPPLKAKGRILSPKVAPGATNLKIRLVKP